LRRESVQVRCHLSTILAHADAVRALVIGDQDQDVGLSRHGRFPFSGFAGVLTRMSTSRMASFADGVAPEGGVGGGTPLGAHGAPISDAANQPRLWQSAGSVGP
jgi:hypothetical protein